ncbi:MAG: hypothetical protein ACR2K3_09870 [Nocardioides sp.]
MRAGAALVALGIAGAVLTACGGHPTSTPSPGSDWSPKAAQVDGLSVVAASDASGFRLHTSSGDKTFLPGVNLGSTTPLHQPGEVGTIPASQYAEWLRAMGGRGVRVVRIYTLPPPGFYDELAAYNRGHATAPIYLMQGVYLPDESYLEPGHTLYDPAVSDAFSRELHDVSDAVHGDLVRTAAPGRAGGHYTTDVSPWLAGWIVGVEWDPQGVARTDRLGRDAPYHPGRYFVAQPQATPTERWIASKMDQLAGWEAERGSSEPMAFANWPTADPLTHPTEPLTSEDAVSIDANHVLPTAAWPGGTFASFHAYPYYPDFQRYEPAIQHEQWNGRDDPYAGYLVELERHFAAHMPLLITEFGVPSSLGTAHTGPLDRGQGDHSEQEAMAMDADLMRMMHAKGIAGAFVFEWQDEWFKKTWNTLEHQQPDRRQLWHDPLTNEQWFGLVATDPDPIPDAVADKTVARGPFRRVHAWADASWVHLAVTTAEAPGAPFTIDADVLPGHRGPDYRIEVDPAGGTAQVYVRRALDPIRLDTQQSPYVPDERQPWHPYRLITNGSRVSAGTTLPAEYWDGGALREGTWDPTSPDYDSTSTWRIDQAHSIVQLRIPWAMLGLADPSSRLALGEGGPPAPLVKIPGLGLTFEQDGQQVQLPFRWPTWNHTTYHAREKAGIDTVEQAFRDLAP